MGEWQINTSIEKKLLIDFLISFYLKYIYIYYNYVTLDKII